MNIDLLIRYLTKEASATEAKAVAQWCREDISHQQELDNLKQVWALSATEVSHLPLDAAGSLKRLREKAALLQKPATLSLPKRNKWKDWTKYAAIFAGIPLMIWFFILQTRTHTERIAQTTTHADTTFLPDGSMAILNRNSALKYPDAFSGDKRTVSLDKGEAFFKVTPNAKKPFVIYAGDITIRVVGTSFNVKIKDGKTEVIVETGKVRVQRKQQEILLKPAESVLVDPLDQDLKSRKQTDLLYTYYRSKAFIANGTPLWKLVEVLNEAYDVQIHIEKDDLKNLRLNTTFKEDSLDEILDVISKTFGIAVHRNGTQILLDR